MKHNRLAPVWLAALSAVLLLGACGKDFQDDIDRLNDQHTQLSQRLSTMEAQASALNTQLGQLSVLATAVEQNFYITQATPTADGYELTLSNGCRLTLQSRPDGTLAAAPSLGMAPLGGLYFWTLGGWLLTDDAGNPIRAAESVPVVRYDYDQGRWVVSIDGGATFNDVSAYTSTLISQAALTQVVDTYVREHTATVFSRQLLSQLVATYLQQNCLQLFDLQQANSLIASYVGQHYTSLFSYSLLEQIFSQYDYEYVTSNIKVDDLVYAIISFLREHSDVFSRNEVLYQIVAAYLQQNQTTLFTEDMLLQAVNTFIADNADYIDQSLLTQVVTDYIDQHRDDVFNTDAFRQLVTTYVSRYYQQAFTQQILIQAVGNYVAQHQSTLFTETLITELITTYVEQNATTLFRRETIAQVVDNYVAQNTTTIFNRELLVQLVTNYFEQNYNLFVDRTVITTTINDYITRHQDTIITVEVVEQIVANYLVQHYREVFTADIVRQLVVSYFEQHQEVITQHIGQQLDIIESVDVKEDLCTVTMKDGTAVRLAVYDAMARLRDRVQSLVVMPNPDGSLSSTHGSLTVDYLVSPAPMAKVIQQLHSARAITLVVRTVDSRGNIGTASVYESAANDIGVLRVATSVASGVQCVALYVKDNRPGGTDIMTEFTPVSTESLACGNVPDDPWPDDTPSPQQPNLRLPVPHLSEPVLNECGSYYVTMQIEPVYYLKTDLMLQLYGTGSDHQNVWLQIDGEPKGIAVTTFKGDFYLNTIQFVIPKSMLDGKEHTLRLVIVDGTYATADLVFTAVFGG